MKRDVLGSKMIKKLRTQAYMCDAFLRNVDALEGKEHAVILVSLVRSSNTYGIGFMPDARCFNVESTRVREAFIVLGTAALTVAS